MKDKALNALLLAGISVGISLAAYFGWFFVALKLPLSKSPEVWGQFGSYMAGTAGVSFALATVWMLADTLRLQRKELGLTRNELALTRREMQRTADAQGEQTKINEKSNNIQRSYYFIKSIEENLNNEYAHLHNIYDSHGFNDRLYKDKTTLQILIKFIDQYMLLIHYKLKQTDKETREDISLLIRPILYKYKDIISFSREEGLFNKYSDDIKAEADIEISFNDLTFEKN